MDQIILAGGLISYVPQKHRNNKEYKVKNQYNTSPVHLIL